MTRLSGAQLDAFLMRPSREVAMWCELCELNAKDCKCPEDHEGHWITIQERAWQEYEDRAYEWYHDECEDA